MIQTRTAWWSDPGFIRRYFDLNGNERSDADVADLEALLEAANPPNVEPLDVDEFEVMFHGKLAYGMSIHLGSSR